MTPPNGTRARRRDKPATSLVSRQTRSPKDRIVLREQKRREIVAGDTTIISIRPSRADLLFKSMSTEIHQHIVDHLPDDRDVTAYGRVCKKSNSSITASVWRKRYTRTFDMIEGATVKELQSKYIFRRTITQKLVVFDTEYHAKELEMLGLSKKNQKNQKWCLAILKDLILESDARKGHDEDGNELTIGLNQQYIRSFVNWTVPCKANDYNGHTDILAAVLNTGKDCDMKQVISAGSDGILPLVMVIQLCLTSFFLQLDFCNSPVAHFDDSQRQAYMCRRVQPTFRGIFKQHLNVHWLLHVMNFFKFHLKGNSEGLFGHAYNTLEPGQLPQVWLGKIKKGTQQLGCHWKGAYTFMEREDLMKIRNSQSDKEPFMDDVNDGHECLQDLTIFFDEKKFSAKHWPRPWEQMLQGDPFQRAPCRPAGNKADLQTPARRSSRGKPEPPEIKHFFGSAVDKKTSHFYGRIHALPPQQGIYGFQRVSMMKFFPDDNGNYDENQVWAYEGCVIPGSRIIIGRWWAPRDELLGNSVSFGGPFIFWNVDNSAAACPIGGEEALEFLDSINDPLLMGDGL